MQMAWVSVVVAAFTLNISAQGTDSSGATRSGDRTPESCRDGERFYNGWCVVDPVLKKTKPPKYPKRAKKELVEAKVVLRAVIQENGRVTDPEVVSCTATGYSFEESAIRAVRQWRYQPARVNGEVQSVYFHINVTFTLE